MAIRSNRSPATGAKNEPSRTSILSSTSLRAALNRAIASARWLTSVATTRSLCVAQVECLHAAAGAEVECRAHVVAQRQLGEAGGGRADPEHVVTGDAGGDAVEAGGQVADHPQVALLRGVGPDVEPGSDLSDGLHERAGVDHPVDEPAGQRALGLGGRDGGLEQEEPGQRRQWAAVRRTTHARRGLVARQRLVRLRAEQPADGVVGEVGGEQGFAERGGEGDGQHGTTLVALVPRSVDARRPRDAPAGALVAEVRRRAGGVLDRDGDAGVSRVVPAGQRRRDRSRRVADPEPLAR